MLATGGGAFVSPETRESIRADGLSIWLKADRDVILQRVRRRSNRPMIKAGDAEAVIDRLLAERSPIYAEADIHIQSREVAHDVVLGDILAALDAWLARETEPV